MKDLVKAFVEYPAQESPATGPLWQMWWFWTLVAAILVIGTWLFYRSRSKSLAARSRALEQRVEEVSQENARLFRDSTRQVHELHALANASRTISSQLDQDQLVHALYEQIVTITPADFHLIGLYDAGTNVISIEVNVDEGVPYPQDRYVLDKGLLQLVIHERQALRFDDLREERVDLPIEIVPSGSTKLVRGWLGVPMLYGEKVLGAIVVGSYRRGAFDEGHEQILTSVASQAAVALENARLFTEAQRRAEEQAVLNQLGQALTARLNVEQVLGEAYRGASHLLDTTNFYVALYNPDEDAITFAIDVKEGELHKPYTTRKAGRGLTEYIIHNRTPLLIEEDLPKKLQELGIDMIGPLSFSWLGVPLIIGDRVLGVMAVQSYTTPCAFDRHDLDLLTAIASPVAIAVQNARLFEETQNRAERLAVVNRIAKVASTTLQPEDLMEALCNEIVPAFRADAFFIALYDEAAHELDFRFRVDQGVRVPAERLPIGVGLSSIVITERRPLVIHDLQERDQLPSASHLFGSMKPAVSWLGAPLLIVDRAIGVISVQSYRARVWDDEDELLLFTIADQVAVAIENAHLFQAEQRRAEQFQLMTEVGSRITSILEIDELMDQIVALIAETFNFYLPSIGLLDGEELVFKDFDAPRSTSEESRPLRLKVGQEGITGWVAQTGQPLVVPNVSQESRYYRLPGFDEIQSELAVPLKVKGRVIGVLDVMSDRLNAFDESDMAVLQSLAHQAAVAIDNARLFGEVEQRVKELEVLYHADEELYSYLDLGQVLQALVDVAVDTLQAGKSSVMVWDAAQENLTMRYARGFDPHTMTTMCFPRDEGIVGQVAATAEPAVVEDALLDPRRAEEREAILQAIKHEGIRAFMHLPIKVRGEVFGVFSVCYTYPRIFTEDEQRLYLALAQRAALAIQNAQLYERSQELAVIQDRQRLARDLHDAVTQTLFSASLIAEVLPALWERDEVKAREYLAQLRDLSRGALAEMRTLLMELRPTALIETSLRELLRQLTDAMLGKTRLSVDFAVEEPADLPSEVHIAIYRIAQEALNNVVKHARASHVAVCLRAIPTSSGQRLELTIDDNGAGFDPAGTPADRLGLGIMRERADAIGAHLQIESGSDGGTRVTLVWP
jgi:GAF domain-containing protein